MRIISFETAQIISEHHLSSILNKTSNRSNIFYSYNGNLEILDPYNIRYFGDNVYLYSDMVYPACTLNELFEFLLNRNIFVSIRMSNSGFYYWCIYIDKRELMTSGDSLKEEYEDCLDEGLREALKYI